MGWTAINNFISYEIIILYISAIFWTLGYDTIYGVQDMADDEIIGIKSTAIKFKKNIKLFVTLNYLISIFLLIYLFKDQIGLNLFSLLFSSFVLSLIIQIKMFNKLNPNNCLKAFKLNNISGLLLFLVFYLLVINMKFQELKQILKRLYIDYVKKHLKKIFLALILSLIVAGSTSATAWLLDPAVKKIFIDQDKTLAWLIPILIILAFSSKGICLYFARINIIRVGQEVSGEIQKQIANNILKSDIQTLDSRHSGKYISNIMFDAIRVQQLVSNGVLNIMKDTFSVIALVSLMFYQNWKLSLFAILMMPLAGGLAKRLGKRIGKAVSQAGELSGKLTSFLSEIFKGSKMIRIYQKEEEENKNAKLLIDNLIEKNIKIQSVQIRATPIMEILTGIMIAGFIFFSGKLIASGELTVNSFFSFLAAMMLSYQPIRSLATINMLAYEGCAAFKRISTIIDAPIKIDENKQLPSLKVNNCNIELKDVGFQYSSNKIKAVKNININIQGGSMAAFVGQSGAGKSTVLNLLPRFYDPQEGKISIDQQDVKKVSLSSLRKYISR